MADPAAAADSSATGATAATTSEDWARAVADETQRWTSSTWSLQDMQDELARESAAWAADEAVRTGTAGTGTAGTDSGAAVASSSSLPPASAVAGSSAAAEAAAAVSGRGSFGRAGGAAFGSRAAAAAAAAGGGAGAGAGGGAGGGAYAGKPLVSPEIEKEGYFSEVAGVDAPEAAAAAGPAEVEEAENDVPHYATNFLKQPHVNYVGESTRGPVVLSVEAVDKDKKVLRAICRSKRGEQRMVIQNGTFKAPFKDDSKALAQLRGELQDSLGDVKLYEVRAPDDHAALEENLVAYEKKVTMVQHYKFGVLYVRGGQTSEDEWFNNNEPPQRFYDFMASLGDKVPLVGHTGYSGGLNTREDVTGTHSFYTNFKDFEIMFHVSPMLPYFPLDKQQVERKRHLGNDVVLIVYKDICSPDPDNVDGNTDMDQPFDALSINSHFNHIFAVVQPEATDVNKYRVSVATKCGVRPYGPAPVSDVFEAGEGLRDFLLTKCINGERSAMHAGEFVRLWAKTREITLQNLVDTFQSSGKKSKAGAGAGGSTRGGVKNFLKVLTDARDSAEKDASAEGEVRRVSRSIVGSDGKQILKEGRRHVFEGPVQKVCRKKNAPRQLFLFNDVLAHCSNATVRDKFVLHDVYQLSTTQIRDMPDTDRLKNAFQIVTTSAKSFVVFVSTNQEKSEWLAKFATVELATEEQEDAAAVWIPDSAAKNCMICRTPFTFRNRRHHCRSCGDVICGSCSKQKMAVGAKKKEARVCKNCFAKADMQILTSEGFLFYEELRDAWSRVAAGELKVAGYDSHRRQIVYQTPIGSLIDQGNDAATTEPFYSFSAGTSAASASSPTTTTTTTTTAALRVTGGHDLYVRRRRRRSSSRDDEREEEEEEVEAFSKIPARAAVLHNSTARDGASGHCLNRLEFLPLAEAGVRLGTGVDDLDVATRLPALAPVLGEPSEAPARVAKLVRLYGAWLAGGASTPLPAALAAVAGSPTRLAPWVWQLNRSEAAALLRGMAGERDQDDDHDDDGDAALRVRLRAAELRDDVVRLALHAGWTASAAPATADDDDQGFVVLELAGADNAAAFPSMAMRDVELEQPQHGHATAVAAAAQEAADAGAAHARALAAVASSTPVASCDDALEGSSPTPLLEDVVALESQADAARRGLARAERIVWDGIGPSPAAATAAFAAAGCRLGADLTAATVDASLLLLARRSLQATERLRTVASSAADLARRAAHVPEGNWCVEMPCGLLVARRAVRPMPGMAPLSASTPVVVGNCFRSKSGVGPVIKLESISSDDPQVQMSYKTTGTGPLASSAGVEDPDDAATTPTTTTTPTATPATATPQPQPVVRPVDPAVNAPPVAATAPTATTAVAAGGAAGAGGAGGAGGAAAPKRSVGVQMGQARTRPKLAAKIAANAEAASGGGGAVPAKQPAGRPPSRQSFRGFQAKRGTPPAPQRAPPGPPKRGAPPKPAAAPAPVASAAANGGTPAAAGGLGAALDAFVAAAKPKPLRELLAQAEEAGVDSEAAESKVDILSMLVANFLSPHGMKDILALCDDLGLDEQAEAAESKTDLCALVGQHMAKSS